MRWNRAGVLPYVSDPAAGNDADLEIDEEDSAPAIPKSVVVDDRFDWEDDRLRARQWTRPSSTRPRQGLHDAPPRGA